MKPFAPDGTVVKIMRSSSPLRKFGGRVWLLAALPLLAGWGGGLEARGPVSAPNAAAAGGVATAGAAAVAAAPAVSGPAGGSGALKIPDVVLIDQDGRKVRFWSDLVQGKVVAISFVFTTCTTICLPLGANFARLRQLLSHRAGASVQLISVSVDPVTDSPGRLKAWAAKFGAGPGWTLVTGPKPDVDRLLRALQAYTSNFADHSPLILIGNAATGVWERTSGLAPAAEIAAQLARLGAPPAEPRPAAP